MTVRVGQRLLQHPVHGAADDGGDVDGDVGQVRDGGARGVRLLQRFAEDVVEFGTVEHNPTIDGRNMVMVIAPLKNKSEAKAEANAQRAAAKARPAADAADEPEAQAAESTEGQA